VERKEEWKKAEPITTTTGNNNNNRGKRFSHWYYIDKALTANQLSRRGAFANVFVRICISLIGMKQNPNLIVFSDGTNLFPGIIL
jgi:hypothetical protein